MTKMAMIFFISALGIILLIFGGFTRTGLCASSAESASNRIASAINQIINSPLEDERRVVPVEPALAIGESKSSRYTLNVTNRVLGDASRPFNQLLISAQSSFDSSCKGGVAVAYPKELQQNNRIFLLSPRSQTTPSSEFRQTIILKPSILSSEPDFLLRTRHVVVMKCTSKTVARDKYLFIQDCTEDDSDDCVKFTSAVSLGGQNRIQDICSFEG